MVLLALTAIGITFVIERDIRRRLVPSGRLEYGVLIASAILSMVISFYSPERAMYAYFLNLASPLVLRWKERVLATLLTKPSNQSMKPTRDSFRSGLSPSR